ncbi:MAG: GIY-YIG nuclease family protein [Pseudomonadota bacterium]
MQKQFAVYLMGSSRLGTIYTGVSSDLVKRVWQHREGLLAGFTSRYEVKLLLWYELHNTADSAITREKQIKKWRRAWKIELVEQFNPYWRDLYESLL